MPANTVNYQESGLDISEKYVSVNDVSLINPLYINAIGGDVLGYGAIWSWGSGTNGSLGSGAIAHRSSPVQVGALTNWKKVYGGGDLGSTYAIKSGGNLWVWGYNSAGQLGTSNITNFSSPVQVGTLTDWSFVSPGEDHALFIKTDKTLWSVGNNLTSGPLGDGTVVSKSSPIQVGTETNWYTASAGFATSYGIKTDGTLWSWGRNLYGQLGDGTINPKSSPVQIGSLTDWYQISAGYESVSAIKKDYTLWSWGRNNAGQLGDGTIIHQSSPIQVGALTDWSLISSGYQSVFSVKTDGSLWSWGLGSDGILGSGAVLSRSSPVQVGALTNWKTIATTPALTSGTVATIKRDGTLWTWGYNTNGGLGDGTVVHKSSPVQIGALTTWKNVGVNYRSTFGIK